MEEKRRANRMKSHNNYKMGAQQTKLTFYTFSLSQLANKSADRPDEQTSNCSSNKNNCNSNNNSKTTM